MVVAGTMLPNLSTLAVSCKRATESGPITVHVPGKKRRLEEDEFVRRVINAIARQSYTPSILSLPCMQPVVLLNKWRYLGPRYDRFGKLAVSVEMLPTGLIATVHEQLKPLLPTNTMKKDDTFEISLSGLEDYQESLDVYAFMKYNEYNVFISIEMEGSKYCFEPVMHTNIASWEAIVAKLKVEAEDPSAWNTIDVTSSQTTLKRGLSRERCLALTSDFDRVVALVDAMTPDKRRECIRNKYVEQSPDEIKKELVASLLLEESPAVMYTVQDFIAAYSEFHGGTPRSVGVSFMFQQIGPNTVPVSPNIHMDTNSVTGGSGSTYGFVLNPNNEHFINSFCVNQERSSVSGDGGTYIYHGIPMLQPEVFEQIADDAITNAQTTDATFNCTPSELIGALSDVTEDATRYVLNTMLSELGESEMIKQLGLRREQTPSQQWTNWNSVAYHRSPLAGEIPTAGTRCLIVGFIGHEPVQLSGGVEKKYATEAGVRLPVAESNTTNPEQSVPSQQAPVRVTLRIHVDLIPTAPR